MWFIPRKFAKAANAHSVESSEEESFQKLSDSLVVVAYFFGPPCIFLPAMHWRNAWPAITEAL